VDSVSAEFDEIFSLLSISFTAHRAIPYSLSEIRVLADTLDALRKRPTPSEEDLMEIYDLLANAGFDLNAMSSVTSRSTTNTSPMFLS
jgi:hypothetical protein